jgi:hypothetical protein
MWTMNIEIEESVLEFLDGHARAIVSHARRSRVILY